MRRRPPRSEVYSAAPSDRTDPDSFQLERLADGGFRLVRPGARALTAHADPGGLRLETGMLRRREDVQGGGYLLVRGAGEQAAERGRTVRRARGSRTVDGVTVLLDDGRLFEIRSAIEQGVLGFELRGWEVSGAYLRAEPAGTRWVLRPTAAGALLPELEAVLLLFAAELAEASEI